MADGRVVVSLGLGGVEGVGFFVWWGESFVVVEYVVISGFLFTRKRMSIGWLWEGKERLTQSTSLA